jgi:hypothetical protein
METALLMLRSSLIEVGRNESNFLQRCVCAKSDDKQMKDMLRRRVRAQSVSALSNLVGPRMRQWAS